MESTQNNSLRVNSSESKWVIIYKHKICLSAAQKTRRISKAEFPNCLRYWAHHSMCLARRWGGGPHRALQSSLSDSGSNRMSSGWALEEHAHSGPHLEARVSTPVFSTGQSAKIFEVLERRSLYVRKMNALFWLYVGKQLQPELKFISQGRMQKMLLSQDLVRFSQVAFTPSTISA